MVTARTRAGERGALATEIVVALGILAVVMLPLSFALVQDTKACRVYYNRAIAMEIVDGEMELLVAGEWRAFQPGAQNYPVRAASATNLPPGEFRLTLHNGSARLEWIPQGRRQGGTVIREAKIK